MLVPEFRYLYLQATKNDATKLEHRYKFIKNKFSIFRS